MQLTGKHQFNAPTELLWDILMDPDTLARVTPGITKLEATGEDSYKAIAEVKMGPVSGKFEGGVDVLDKKPTDSFTLNVKQNSRIGNVSAEVKIKLKDLAENQSEMSFDGEAKLSGLLARTGNRVLSGVANTLTKQFFKAMEEEVEARTPSA